MTSIAEHNATTILAAVARAMGPGWSWHPSEKFPRSDAEGELAHDDLAGGTGARFLLVAGSCGQGGRVEITGTTSHALHKATMAVWHDRPKPITVALDRGAATIAAEIKRRLLEPWSVHLAKILAAHHRMTKDHEAALALAQRVCGACGARFLQNQEADPNRTEYELWHEHGRLRISHGGRYVQLDRFQLTPDGALHLLKEAVDRGCFPP